MFTGSPRFSVIVRVRIKIRVFMEVVLLLDLVVTIFMELVSLLDLVVTIFTEVVVLLLDPVVTVVPLAHFAEIRPDEPSNIPSFSAVQVNHAPQRVCVKDDAP